MHRPRERFGIFLSRTDTIEMGIIEQEQQQEFCEINIQ
jgi:hypothetical protein